MQIHVDFRAMHHTRWREYAIRYVFGGVITAVTGVIAKYYGPEIAGLFLAFPAIVPATATLIEKHEKERKHRAGLHGTVRGRTVASVDAAGASLGSIGLIAFGAITWLVLPHLSAGLVLALAAATWFVVSFAAWGLRKLM